LANIYNVTNWANQFWFHTGGTRAKKYLLNPDNNKFYYFKVSQYKEGEDGKPSKDFRYEFWCEIIAYELGKMLGFNVLRYDIAIYENIVGCISESMIDTETEELVEGIKFLQAYDSSFTQNTRSNRSNYTFQLIEKSLNTLTDKDFIPEFLKIIIFDCLIGNGDRHQENWAIISKISRSTKKLVKIENEGINNRISRIKKWILYSFVWDHDKNKLRRLFSAMKIIIDREKTFAPIYDSGSSLGRELSPERVNQLINDEGALKTYISKGKSEIHYNNIKLSHFDLIVELSQRYRNEIISLIDNISTRFNKDTFIKILDEIDNKIPENLSDYKIPKERKTLIVKLVTSRYQMLKQVRETL